MTGLKKLSYEIILVSLQLSIILAGWNTAIAAGTVHQATSTVPAWVHFTLYALGGFFLFTLLLAILPALASVPFRLTQSSRRIFILSGILGLSLTVVFPVTDPELIAMLLPSLSGIRGLIVTAGFILLAFTLSVAAGIGAIYLFEKLAERTRWQWLWGFWGFMVTVPPAGIALRNRLAVPGVFLQVGIFIVFLIVIIFLILRILPRIISFFSGSAARKLLLVVAGVGLFFITGPGISSERQGLPADDENTPIILLTIDTLRPDALGCYPEKTCLRLPTPNMDSLADEGTLFEYAYSTSPWTLPSVASYISGLPPSAHGAVDERYQGIGKGATNLPEILAESGYATGAVVVNTMLGPGRGFDDGFDYYVEEFSEFGQLNDLIFSRLLYRLRTKTVGPSALDDHYVFERDAVRRALGFASRHKNERFFLWLHLFAPHGPYFPPETYRDLTSREFDMDYSYSEFLTNINLKTGVAPITPERLERVLALYAGDVKFTDDNVGDFFDGLRELGIYDDCLIVFSSDHGEEFFEHDRINHGHALFPELVHVPLIIRWPGKITAGKRIETRLSLVDLPPTILDLARVEPLLDSEPARFTGRSFLPLISGIEMDPVPIFFEAPYLFDRAAQGVIFNDLYYIGGEDSVYHRKMYDLTEDNDVLYNILNERPDDADYLEDLLVEYTEMCESIAMEIGSFRGKWDDEALRALGYIN